MRVDRNPIPALPGSNGVGTLDRAGANPNVVQEVGRSGAGPVACAHAGPPALVLDRFDFDRDRLSPVHDGQVNSLAQRIAASQSSPQPIRAVCIIGHTDPVGSVSYNLTLGRRRAEQVAQRLRAALERQRPGTAGSLSIAVDSRGEAQPITGDAARSRRVELFLHSPAAPPAPPRPTPPAPRPPSPGTGLNPARWTSIMRGSELRTGNFVNSLVDGDATFEAMHRALRTAKTSQHYIYLLGWSLSDDVPLLRTSPPGVPTTIRDLFADASRRGVQIRAMLWDQFGTRNTPEVNRIDALANGAAILDNHTISTGSRLVNVGSHHQKVLVVKGDEGLIGFCGGVDIYRDRVAARGGGGATSGGSGSGLGSAVISSSSSSSSSGGGSDPIHDVHCRVVGPSAHDLLETFIRRWDAHPRHAGIDRAKGDLRGRREPVPAPLPPRAVGLTGGNCAVRITRTYNPRLPLAPGTRAVRERSIRQTLMAAIQNAQRFIYMEDQYLVSQEAAALLNSALGRIQHLTILIPDSRISDMPRVWEGRLRFLTRLRAGPHGHKVRVFILSTPPNRPGTSPTFGPHTYVHAKTWIFDDELAVIGSANCNNRGWTHDSETNAVIFEDRNPAGPTFAQRLRMQLWSEHLNVPSSAVQDGVASASLWTTPPPGAKIRPYDPRADTDPFLKRQIPWGIIDPAGP